MKRREEGRWDLAWGGIAGLGLALPVLWTAMTRRGFGIERVGAWMAAAPAGWPASPAERERSPRRRCGFVVFDPDAEWTVAQEHLHFRHKLSPYLGAKLRGRVQQTGCAASRSSAGMALHGRRRAEESWCAHERIAPSALSRNADTSPP
jgi:allantoinase